ncbi:MAG: hypothetical protein AAGN46_09130 [Acidobacteriota bacterium]
MTVWVTLAAAVAPSVALAAAIVWAERRRKARTQAIEQQLEALAHELHARAEAADRRADDLSRALERLTHRCARLALRQRVLGVEALVASGRDTGRLPTSTAERLAATSARWRAEVDEMASFSA